MHSYRTTVRKVKCRLRYFSYFIIFYTTLFNIIAFFFLVFLFHLPSKVKPFAPGSGQSKISRKILNFTFSNPTKLLVPCESAAEEVSFEWSHDSMWIMDVFKTDSGGERVNIQLLVDAHGLKASVLVVL